MNFIKKFNNIFSIYLDFSIKKKKLKSYILD